MKLIKITALGLLLGCGAFTIPSIYAADPKATAEEKVGETAAEAAARAVPFQGRVSAVDLTGHTFTINGKTKDKDRVFKVMDGTQILLNNQQSEFKAIVVGEIVRGQAYKRADGWDAKKVMLGPKEEAAAKKEDAPVKK